MADFLNVERREEQGTLRMRRMRNAGLIPAVLYGHGEGNVLLKVPARDIEAAIRHGSQVVKLQGAVTENALIKDVHWDALGTDVLHMDLFRVKAGEKVEVSLSVELVGEAPGTKSGGVIRHQLHELEILCPALKVPEKLELRINDLELHQSMVASEVSLPDGAELVTGADEIVVQCVEVVEVEDQDEEGAPAEPEVIGRKAEEEDGE